MTEALESFAFNVAVARLYELANAITEAERAAPEAGLAWARREAVEMLARLSSPMMPHLAEEVYARLFPDNGHLVAELTWPEADPALLVAESVTIAVQVMGKLRGTIEVAPNAPADSVLAAAEAEPTSPRRWRASASSSGCTCPTGSSTSWWPDEARRQPPSGLSRGCCRLWPVAGSNRSICRPRRARPAWRSANSPRSTCRLFRNGRASCCARRCRSASAMISGRQRRTI